MLPFRLAWLSKVPDWSNISWTANSEAEGTGRTSRQRESLRGVIKAPEQGGGKEDYRKITGTSHPDKEEAK